MLSRSENIFKGSISVTEHQGMWAKAKPEIISDASARPFTKGLQLGSPRVPLSLSLSLPSSSGMSLRCRSQASSSRDHSRSESGPHQALPSSHLRAGVEGGVGRLGREGSSGEEQELHRGRSGQTASGGRSKLRQGEGPEETACKWPRDEGAGGGQRQGRDAGELPTAHGLRPLSWAVGPSSSPAASSMSSFQQGPWKLNLCEPGARVSVLRFGKRAGLGDHLAQQVRRNGRHLCHPKRQRA